MPRRLLLMLGIVVLGLLGGCGNQDSPVNAVQSYVAGRVASDTAKLQSLACKDQESQALTDADSFRSMKASVDSMTCTQAGEDAPYTIVACQGKILTEYAGETRTWNLADRNFRTIKEDGQWKVCGYQAAP
ncbi:MAG: hypothetical protein ABI947_15875 [Chloroflexota bacterium]